MTGEDIEYGFDPGDASHLRIRNNLFENCNYGVRCEAAIRIFFGGSDEPGIFSFNRNIGMENNEFRIFDFRMLKVSSTDNLIFRNNRIFSAVLTDRHTKAEPFDMSGSTGVQKQ